MIQLAYCSNGHLYNEEIFRACPECEGKINAVREAYYICPKCGRPDEKTHQDHESGLCPDCVFYEQQIFCERCGSLYDKSKYQACPYCNGAKKPDMIRRDENGVLYADFDPRILRIPGLRQCSCGHFTKDTACCAVCGGFVGSVSFTDPVEYTKDYKQVQAEIKKQLEAEFPPGGALYLGKIHDVWHRKQQILLERYHIQWRTPAEMNPNNCYD